MQSNTIQNGYLSWENTFGAVAKEPIDVGNSLANFPSPADPSSEPSNMEAKDRTFAAIAYTDSYA